MTAVPIKNLLPLVLKKVPYQKRLETLTACALYQELISRILNKRAAKNSRAFEVKNKVLWIEASSSVWSCEISFYTDAVIQEINKRLGHKALEKIRFRVKA